MSLTAGAAIDRWGDPLGGHPLGLPLKQVDLVHQLLIDVIHVIERDDRVKVVTCKDQNNQYMYLWPLAENYNLIEWLTIIVFHFLCD